MNARGRGLLGSGGGGGGKRNVLYESARGSPGEGRWGVPLRLPGTAIAELILSRPKHTLSGMSINHPHPTFRETI
jgi:hypothetical protein